MPQLLRIRLHLPGHRPFGLWIPVIPVLIVFSPLLLLAVLAGMVACLIWRIDPLRALIAAGRLLGAVKGMRVEVDQPDVRLLVDVR